MGDHVFTALFPFGGLGAGARGFIEAIGRLGPDAARFKNLGGIDLDPDACRDFEMLSGAPSLCADLSALEPAHLLAWLELHHGELARRTPDCVFTSPPCKGFSRLLGNKKALEKKYQALNQLVFQGLFLMCEAWPTPPKLIVLENVPGIVSRGAEILAKARQLLSRYGYAFHTATHDCGEIGGLAQHRRRFLLVARHEPSLRAYVYQPPKKRVRACGEVLQELPIPGGDAGGELHRLPKLSWLNWVRLALIPAGGDWRDLPKAITTHADNPNAHRNKHAVGAWTEPAPTVIGATRPGSGAASVADPRLGVAVGLKKTADNAERFRGSPGLFGVNDWNEPAPTVTGRQRVSGSNAPAAVADPRALGFSKEPFKHVCRVTPFDQPVGAITASPSPSSGAGCVADPRIPPELLSPVAEGAQRRSEFPKYDVRPWGEPARTVAGTGTNGGFAVADPRVGVNHRKGRHTNQYKVQGWNDPARTVTGDTDVQAGAQIVADPRASLAMGNKGPAFSTIYKVSAWEEPIGAVTGAARPGSGAPVVADPRIGLGHSPRRNAYEVGRWSEPAKSVRGRADVRTGPAAIADPRPVNPAEIPTCVCRSGSYGVMSWQQAADTITGSASVDNGRVAVADPRKPPDFIPVIIAADETWHRPLTTLELAALQGLPTTIDGKPLKLHGHRVSSFRERIGNAVPVGAGTAIAETLLKALLAGALGTWFLSPSGEPIWVRKDGRTERDFDEAGRELFAMAEAR